MGIFEKEDHRRQLHEMSHKKYGGVGKGGIWGPEMSEFNRLKHPMQPTAKSILKECELPIDRLGWAQHLEDNDLQIPPLQDGSVYDRTKWETPTVRNDLRKRHLRGEIGNALLEIQLNEEDGPWLDEIITVEDLEYA